MVFKPGQSGNPKGKRKGTQNKATVQLREAILGALEAAGGEEGSVGYLTRLAVENSSAFVSLLCKILPSTLSADKASGNVKIQFQRVIVFPDGHREIEGVAENMQHDPARLPHDEIKKH